MKLFLASFNSDQLANAAASPPSMNNPSTDGYLKIKFFSWTGTAAQNDTVNLVKLPKGARVLFGRVLTTALGTGVTLELGDGTTATEYLGSTSVAAISSTDFANTAALNGAGSQGDLSAEITLVATLGGAAPTSGTIQGFVAYSEV